MTEPVGGMTFPGGMPPPASVPPGHGSVAPQPVPTIPADLLAWGAGVRQDLANVCEKLTAIRMLLETQQAQRRIEFKVAQEQRELLLKIASTKAARGDAQ